MSQMSALSKAVAGALFVMGSGVGFWTVELPTLVDVFLTKSLLLLIIERGVDRSFLWLLAAPL